jgi:hypothetical protein
MNKAMDVQFEAWARKMSMDLEYRNIPGVGQFYECPRTLLAFEAWQASRAAIEVELPDYTSPFYGGDHFDECQYAADCEKAIESLGLKVKPC